LRHSVDELVDGYNNTVWSK